MKKSGLKRIPFSLPLLGIFILLVISVSGQLYAADPFTEYQQVTQKTTEIQNNTQVLQRLINSQEKEMASLQKQMRALVVTHREITPLTLKMLESLEQFIMLDIPFLHEERQNRITALKTLRDRSDTDITELYRRVMAAYLIEAGYGSTMERYSAEIKHEGRSLLVNFLRIGRLSLSYLTPDEKTGGYWDQKKRMWIALPPEYIKSVSRGLRMAKKETASTLLKLPLPAPEQVQ